VTQVPVVARPLHVCAQEGWAETISLLAQEFANDAKNGNYAKEREVFNMFYSSFAPCGETSSLSLRMGISSCAVFKVLSLEACPGQ
jgi:hypothetical protein